jgi:hypothetical protein
VPEYKSLKHGLFGKKTNVIAAEKTQGHGYGCPPDYDKALD